MTPATRRRDAVVLGTRWFVRAPGAQRRLRWQRVIAVGIAVFVAIVGVTLWLANDDRADRARGQEPHPAVHGDAAFRVRQVDAPYAGDVWSTIFVATEIADPPAPPGLEEFPAPGEVWVSPAVKRLVDDEDPAAERLPGPVTGVVGAPGLQSPDQLFVYVGEPTAGAGWWRAEGWGAEVEATARPTVPRWPLLALIVVLVGLPVLVLVRGTARMATEARTRDLAALHLLGVARRTLSLASATDAAWCAATGVAIGAATAGLVTWAVHPTRVLGFSWYQPDILEQVLVAVVVGAVALTLVCRDVTRQVRRALADPWGARAGRPPRWRPWRLVPLAVGLSLLLGVVLPYIAVGARFGSLMTTVYFFMGAALGLLGAVVGLAGLLGWWAGRLERRGQSASGFLGSRRLRWDRERIATACAGLVLTCVSSAVGAGALADLSALSPERAGGDRYAVGLGGLDGEEARSAVLVGGGLRYIQVSRQGATVNVADCRTFTAILALTDAASSRHFGDQCRAGEEQNVVAGQPVSPTDIVMGVSDPSGLSGSTVLTVPVEDYAGSLKHAELLVYPGAGQDSVDDYVDGLLASAPHAQITNTVADSYQPMVAPTRRLLIVCSFLGLLVGVTLLALVSLSALHRTRVQNARLTVMGSSRRLAATAHTKAFAHGAAVAVAVGLAVGLLAGTAYTIAGGITTGLGNLGLVVVGLAVGLAGAGIVATWALARFVPMGTPTELMQRE